MFKYKNGNEGVCSKDGKEICFETEAVAAAFAKKLNEAIDESVKEFFPVWFVIKANDLNERGSE